MSVRVMADVWDSALTDRAEVMVLLVLANYANDAGGNCFPSIELIAAKSRLSPRQVTRVLQSLESGGWVVVNRGRGSGKMSSYTIVLESLKRCHGVTFPEPKQKVTFATKKGDMGDRKGDICEWHIRRTVMEPPVTKSKDTPLPPVAGGSVEEMPVRSLAVNDLSNPAQLETAANEVMRACGWTRRRVRAQVKLQLRLRMEQGEAWPAVAAQMVAAWSEHADQSAAGLLRYKVGAEKFVGDGLWANQNAWPWDLQRIDRMREARVGVR